ncbi:MAG: hypothetical protein MUE60_12270 [Candidatus Eisenbacteria bacterium]|jgi:hypothetical protein|nr:hypothetical protein [Candidatus Eisenbacteria bacterium]
MADANASCFTASVRPRVNPAAAPAGVMVDGRDSLELVLISAPLDTFTGG